MDSTTSEDFSDNTQRPEDNNDQRVYFVPYRSLRFLDSLIFHFNSLLFSATFFESEVNFNSLVHSSVAIRARLVFNKLHINSNK